MSLPETTLGTQARAPKYPNELHHAIQAVHLASLLTKAHLLRHLSSTNTSATSDGGGGVTASTKADKSEVTVADFASQAVIISLIHAAFPDDVFIAEESGGMLRRDDELRGRVWRLLGSVREVYARCSSSSSKDRSVGGKEVNGDGKRELKLPENEEEMVELIDLGQVGGRNTATGTITSPNTNSNDSNNINKKRPRTWILDPIDGTKTYIRGHQYVVCLCLVDDDEQQVAVMGCPNLNLDRKDDEGRVIVQEELVDLTPEGGWIVSCVKGRGVDLTRLREPFGMRPVGEVLAWDGVPSIRESDAQLALKTSSAVAAANPDKQTTNTCPIHLHFTDSTASPHVSMDLHTNIFTSFSPTPSPTLSSPLNIWSMQLKFILLALRTSSADALIRVPPDPDYHASVWDHAGGQLLVRESGGVLTDAKGRPFVLDGRDRKLVGNWGVVTVRGGGFLDDGGGGAIRQGNEVHGEVLARVRREIEQREARGKR